MEHWFTRTLAGCSPADEDCAKALKHYAIGSTFPMDLATRKTRSGQWHRKYWVLLGIIASNVERIEIEPGGFMEVRDKDDVHVALKYLTGLYDAIVTPGAIIKLVKSTAFDAMDADEWATYWKKVLDVIHQKILPGVESSVLEDEIARAAS